MTEPKASSLLQKMMADSNAIVARKQSGQIAPGPSTKPATAVDPARVAVDATFPNDIPLDALRMHVQQAEGLAADAATHADQLAGLARRLRETLDTITGHMRGETAGIEPASEAAIAEIVAAAPPVLATGPSVAQIKEANLPPLPANMVFVTTAGEWTCPTHAVAVTKTSTRTGRSYRACPTCDEIERRN